MNELVLEALRLLLAAELRRDVTQAAEARALVDRIDAMLGVMRQDRGVASPAADWPQPHRWHWDRRPWSGEYAFWCDGCGVWSAVGGSLPAGPCPGRREPEREAGGGG